MQEGGKHAYPKVCRVWQVVELESWLMRNAVNKRQAGKGPLECVEKRRFCCESPTARRSSC